MQVEKFLKWEEILNADIQDWSKYFVLLKKSCRDTYLVSFQYKLLHRIIPTNTFLYKIKLKDTKLCTFCKTEDETIEHLFYECTLVHTFWENVLLKVQQFFVNFELDKKQIFLGYDQESKFLNFIVLFAKNYIFRCKLKDQIPNIVDMKNRIEKYHSAEVYSALKNNKLHSCERFWAPLQIIF